MKKYTLIIPFILFNSCITRPVVITYKDSGSLGSVELNNSNGIKVDTVGKTISGVPSTTPYLGEPTNLILTDAKGIPLSSDDTVEVIIVYSDTALHNTRVEWMKGYVVGYNITTMPTTPPIYLDENKKPLSKNIIVLFTK